MHRLLPCLIALVLAACDGTAVDPAATGARSDFETATDAPVATLRFDAAWTETVTGAVVAGGTVAVDYDAARLPNCRASHNGNPGWQITATLRFLPGATVAEQGIFEHALGPNGPDYYSWVHTIPQFDVPAGTTEIQLWFKNTSGFDRPCEEWDSDYGANYRFPVAGASTTVGTMAFQSDWRNVQGGTVARGGTLLVTYAPARLQSIVDGAISQGYFASKYHCYGYGCCSYALDDTLYVRFQADGAFASFPVGAAAVALTVPADATRVELYFETAVTTTTWYCGGGEGQHYPQGTQDHFFDSNYGHNFVYTMP
ncbi:MAG TPA: DUF6209 family protein [Polyangia bacterium]|jgi:hypothetical protein